MHSGSFLLLFAEYGLHATINRKHGQNKRHYRTYLRDHKDYECAEGILRDIMADADRRLGRKHRML